jgi:hypothetical protein
MSFEEFIQYMLSGPMTILWPMLGPYEFMKLYMLSADIREILSEVYTIKYYYKLKPIRNPFVKIHIKYVKVILGNKILCKSRAECIVQPICEHPIIIPYRRKLLSQITIEHQDSITGYKFTYVTGKLNIMVTVPQGDTSALKIYTVIELMPIDEVISSIYDLCRTGSSTRLRFNKRATDMVNRIPLLVVLSGVLNGDLQ